MGETSNANLLTTGSIQKRLLCLRFRFYGEIYSSSCIMWRIR